jgi:hypothetical protein
MCNCGKKREAIKQVPSNNNINSTENTIRSEQKIRPLGTIPVKRTVGFQYTGNTALSITGSITKKNYRFNFPGDIQAVDFNDASAMLGVPVLRRV